MASATLELPQFKGRPGWEFTPLPADFSLEDFPLATGGDLGRDVGRTLPIPEGAVELLQVDGTVGEGVAVEDGPVVLPLREALERHPELVEPHLGTLVPGADLFTVSNERDWDGGAFVYVPRGVAVEKPILLTAILASAVRMERRTLIVLADGAEAEVWEQWIAAGDDEAGVVNAVTEIVVGAGARLKYVTAQELNEKSYVFGTQRAEVARDGSLTWAALGFGAKTGRIGMYTRLSGPGAEARVTGAYATGGRQHIDYDTTQEHGAEHCFSDLAFRGIVNNRSSAVWKGNIIVDPGAQKTDAFQECRNLLLTKQAHADAIPGLEILANDVRCTHAAAVAQIDAEQLFYLQSRGMPTEVAKRLVVEGFLSALVERFDDGSELRTAVAAALEHRLADLLG